MAKQKIHELAKELKLTNKVIVDYLNRKVKDKEKKIHFFQFSGSRRSGGHSRKSGFARNGRP